jgi:hypothetical protein
LIKLNQSSYIESQTLFHYRLTRPYVIDAIVLEDADVSTIFGDEEGEMDIAHSTLKDDTGEIRLVSLLSLNSSILDLKQQTE